MKLPIRIAFALLAGAAVAAISGYLAASWAVRNFAASHPAVSAREFVLTDAGGHIGAKLTWENNQPAIQLFDRASHIRSALFLEPNGVPDLYLYDSNHQVRAALNLLDSGVPNLAFLDQTEKYMVSTELDNQRSYNTVFTTIGIQNNTRNASRRMTVDGSGLHVRDMSASAQ